MTELCYDDVSVGDHIPTLTVTVDETQMFFFSAATYNGHRIHYDKEWARAEGYDDVLVHGPLQAALLARALGDWIGGRGRLVSFSVQNRAVAYPGEPLSFGGRVTGKRLDESGSGLVDLDIAGRRDDTVLMPGTATVAAIVGIAELPAERRPTGPPRFTLDQYALLAKLVIEDAGVDPGRVNGLLTHGVAESAMFAPATLCEYLGLACDFGERVDLGGASSAGMVWRAAAAVELGICEAALAVVPGSASVPHSARRPPPESNWYGASSNNYGSPQAEFEIPYGNVGQNAPYAQIAQRYAAEFGYDPAALAKIAVDQRTNACAHPGAVFFGTPITAADVLDSPMIADPIHMLETVMRVHGGAAVLIANADLARRGRHRPVWIKGFGEHIAFKTPTYAEDLLSTPIARAAERAFAMAGLDRPDVDVASIYDCYTITVLMSLEDAGFCAKGQGMQWIGDHDLTHRGDFPLNTAGGQLSFGQAGMAGGMHHVVDGARQIMGRAGDAQVPGCHTAFVTGNGGIMSEQVALLLQGE